MSVALADSEYTITITNSAENVSIIGKTYSAYKLFDMTYTGSGDDAAYSYSIDSDGDGAWAWQYVHSTVNSETGVYTNSNYGLTFTPTAADPTVYAITSTMTDEQARALADALATHLPSTADGSVVAAAENNNVITLDEAGYYVVYGTAKHTADATDELVAAVALTSTDPAATVNPKVEAPKLDKKITSSDGNTTTTVAADKDGVILDATGQAAVAAVGKTVSFELDSNVPDLTGYIDYTFIISDTMSDGLSFTGTDTANVINGLTVSIDGTVLTADKYTVAHTVGSKTFTVTIPFATLSVYDAKDPIVVTYSAIVNEGALTTNYEKNTAKLTYSHSPYDDTTNETPEEKVYVIDINIDVFKYFGSNDDEHKLGGAQFQLFKGNTKPADNALAWYKYDTATNAVTWVAKANADTFTTQDATGKFNPQVRGLSAGTYGLLETAAPAGYNLLDAPVIVTITAADTVTSGAATAATFSADKGTMTGNNIDLTATPAAQPVDTLPVENQSGTELPSTGGIGTTIFYVAGGILVLAAVILLVTKRRMNAND